MSELWHTIQENIAFVITAAAIFAVLMLLAGLAEKLSGRKTPRNARYISVCAMCAALSGLLMLLEIPLFFAPGFYKIDLSELPVLFCGFSLGPVAGVLCEFVKIIIKLLLKGTATAFVGEFANFAVGCAMILPAATLYLFRRTKKGAVLSLILGTLTMTVFGSLFNAVYLLPKFSQLFGLPMEAIIDMGTAINPSIRGIPSLVLYAVVPLNLLKGTIVSLLTFALYKRVARALFRA